MACRKKTKTQLWRKHIKSSQKLSDKWKKGGDYGKYMQDITYFCGLSGVRISLLETLSCARQLYFVWRTLLHFKYALKKVQ